MGAQGTTVVDFGAFPGSSHATVAVSQPSILGSSLVEAFLFGSTSDHSEDEHRVESIAVQAGDVQAGVGFTIHAWNTSELSEPVEPRTTSRGGTGTRLYGQWSVGWVWN